MDSAKVNEVTDGKITFSYAFIPVSSDSGGNYTYVVKDGESIIYNKTTGITVAAKEGTS